MIACMQPTLVGGEFVFVTSSAAVPELVQEAIAMFQEAEGTSLILPLLAAQAAGMSVDAPMRQITLKVHSSLEGVGLTAAISNALADANIACNVVAAYHHDHIFVPRGQAHQALGMLKALQSSMSDSLEAEAGAQACAS